MSLGPSQQSNRSTVSTSSLITPSLLAITDGPSTQSQIDASVQDYFLIELVHTLRRSSQVARDRLKKREEEMLANGLLPPSVSLTGSATASGHASASSGLGSGAKTSLGTMSTVGGASAKAPVNEEEEAIRLRLDALGAHVGANVAERFVLHAFLKVRADVPKFMKSIN